MKKVFVSGCYDIVHAGHIQFFQEARALGDHLVVCFASDEVLWAHKHRRSSLPQDHKRALLESLTMIDKVVMGTGTAIGLDFEEEFLRMRPDILAVTEDSGYESEKRKLCAKVGAEYVILPKTPPEFTPVSTSSIVGVIQAENSVPLRVDFAGGWLDVPHHSMPNGYIVNCAISPLVSLREWDYQQRSGLGGSGAWALLNGRKGVEAELDLGVGWQDPAVIKETGCCVWRSGQRPVLDFKRNGDFLSGCLAILWTGAHHDTPNLVDQNRDYQLIAQSSRIAREGVLKADLATLAEGVSTYYRSQLNEGMSNLPEAPDSIAKKYCGGGWGGYALYIFDNQQLRNDWVSVDTHNRRAVEPYLKSH